ncbi:Dolichyl-phosphate-mannose--protein mannosyltransferase 4 [Ophidiomyces ophidiicola]|uniref:Dolichyl-phosphate-mannose--protein mannosyltransferase 4 n=1 Tax=Ophidiomyces ophidiicola TaxID=1387563 RepID=A0ACB8UUT3_9EURO|nr:Dolichyl-phosphate-mannose--protein mannosyltransferase 4 [Ophidiomyces ophidiicola]KAI1908710.1 Dolichyl-phosphate-mannose--protein mannosyltransferase 4 [Ophidiomyces ophidiicola]KAI1917196.1 Dolichyl-phosphate-mannose--protein mannosyltransferase 4 [Ophidiomyces ophidiicola]KAI1929683.1 Dolichyl-phosphate-mannose--protein mannosyltransferase 4 [Ophidiomyces ophidiicola]KAI1937488.1 Dolichyl-phosphate-mannose--protein mannosyltransferase 4 [Ophidiomyces ophidiicola]KAI1946517.1 Dolichyl-p
MDSSPPGLRQRGGQNSASPAPQKISKSPAPPSLNQQPSKKQASEWSYRLAITVITILAFVTRFYKISYPDEVVFDEVHFGKFASYYLQRTYFFDVHPPFAKLLFAFVGWFVGYDGHFLFDNIGDSYIKNKVPYVAFRALPATQGALTVPVVFLIMWESGYSLPACILSSSLVLFDNAHIAEDRLILLDATLVISMALSILCYVRFYKLRHASFTRKWWKWLLLTGISLSCVISTKYVGLFTFVTIGSAVLIDLWNLLDINRRGGALTMLQFGQHFAARAFGLIVVPFFFYLFWFQIHFAILNKSGPGDNFMSPEFQETLADNALASKSMAIQYYDMITIRHKQTNTYLHSHPEKYPLRYEDGRISSQGQQVTGYPYNDTNNHWQLLPSVAFPENDRVGHAVKNGDTVQLRHVVTDTILLTHDVASPSLPTNQEFTTVSHDLANGDRHNDTLFEIKVDGIKRGEEFRTMASLFKLIHVSTKVAMWTHTTPLPDWAFQQAEINGNKNAQDTSNIWFAEDIPSLEPENPRLTKEPRKVKQMPFLKKYLELQAAMFYHNNALTSSHPYASEPFQWPFLLRGVSFWTKNDTRQQIYFLGNPIGWWIASTLLAVFAGIVGADQLSLRRGVDSLEEVWGPGSRSRFYNSTGFFYLCWAAHYFPFYLMGRQRFLHHYLPAHIASCLVTGALVEFLFNVEPITTEDESNNQFVGLIGGVRRRLSQRSIMTIWAATMAILSIVLWGFWFFAPLTYGSPGLDVAGVNARKWLSYDLHFAK